MVELNELLNTDILLEIIAVVFGLLSVWFAKKANILVYPTGIVSVLIYVYICLNAQLYADMGINAFYFVMSVYGWIMWTRKTDNSQERPITFSTKKDYIISSAMFVFSLVFILFLLKYFNGDDAAYWESGVPYIDTFTTSIFIVGMWQMAMKKVENWIFWIIGDVISIPLYYYKDLQFTSIQFIVFLIIAVMGYFEWKKKAETEKQIA